MTPIKEHVLVEAQRWRYATKRFDTTRQIRFETWEAIEDSLVLTPSSYGLQPWNFLVIKSPELRKALREKSWNQAQVEDASHFVVLTALREMSEAHIDNLMNRTASVRSVDVNSLAGFRKAIIGDAVTGPRSKFAAEWNARQCYIALGNLMTSAALLGVDTCPLEGFDPLAYDEILNLKEGPYQSIVACALGYRHIDDKYSASPKVRFEKTDLVKYL
jgi:nitroreductase